MPTTSARSVSTGMTRKSASMRGNTRKRSGPIPMVRRASISSETFIVPSSAAKAAPERPQTMMAVISGPSSRVMESPMTRPT